MLIKKADVLAYEWGSMEQPHHYCLNCIQYDMDNNERPDWRDRVDGASPGNVITKQDMEKGPALLFCDECGGLIYETPEKKKKPKRKKKAKAKKAKVSGGAGLGAGSTESKK